MIPYSWQRERPRLILGTLVSFYVLSTIITNKVEPQIYTEPTSDRIGAVKDTLPTSTTFRWTRKRAGPRTSFRFHQLPRVFCSNPSSKLRIVIGVHSAPDHFHNRLIIRKTWGSAVDLGQAEAGLFFILGETLNSSIHEMIAKENAEFGDIVQYDALDTYRNLTYKSIADLAFLDSHCQDSGYSWFFKTDDDMFLNLAELAKIVDEIAPVNGKPRRVIVCEHVFHNAMVHKKPGHKWFVRWQEWRSARFPVHCPGSLNLFPSELIGDLLEQARDTRILWVDDVYITGILAQKLGGVLHLELPRGRGLVVQHLIQNLTRMEDLYSSFQKVGGGDK